ncbi:Clr5 domain-containing protein [Annulohypoxylon moriforme]|nr:Clr5 domain-containing protein [Annulohypoxylon moriforme]
MARSFPNYVVDPKVWDNHRENITWLYIIEDCPLREIRIIMEACFGFRATERMYTTRLTKWGLKKNYSAAEKDRIIEQISNTLTNRQTMATLSFRDQPIKYQRVLRHARSKRQPAPHSMQGSGQKDQQKTERSGLVVAGHHSTGCSTAASLPGRVAHGYINWPQDATVVPGSGIQYCIDKLCPGEITLRATHILIESFARSPYSGRNMSLAESQTDSPTVEYGAPLGVTEFWGDMAEALYLLRTGNFELGWPAFHQIWKTAADIVLDAPAILFRRLLTISPLGYLGHMSGLRDSILQFLADLLSIRLGNSHPLAQICFQLRHDSQSQWTLESALRLTLELYQKLLGPYHSETFDSHMALVVCQRRDSNFEAAQLSAEALVKRCYSSANLNCRIPKSLNALAIVLKDQGHYDRAIQVHHRILSGEVGVLTEREKLYSNECLAELYRFQGQWVAESRHLREALDVSQRIYGYGLATGAATTLHIEDMLKTSLTKQGLSLTESIDYV